MAKRQGGNAGAVSDADALHIPLGMLSDLVAATTKADILDWMSKWSGHLLDARHSVIALAHGSDSLLVTSFTGPTISGKDAVVAIEGSFLGTAYRTHKTNILLDVARSEHPMRSKFLAGGIKTLVVTPIIAQNHCFGTFGVGLGPEFAALDQVITFLETLARCLANQLLIIEQITQLDRLTRIDPLTESYNRRHLAECAADIWSAWENAGVTFGIVTLDLDHFKKINDGFGHEAGDVVLKVVAQRIRGEIRPSDTLIRMGGEEFCLLISAATMDVARHMGHRIWQAIRADPITTPENSIPVSASVGFAVVDVDDASYHSVLRRADVGLYQAKETGRDQVCAGDIEYAS